MGADGHVGIYNWEKVKQRFKKDELDFFLREVRSSTMYLQELENKLYLTRYYGSNIYESDTYEIIKICYDKTTDSFNKKNYCYSSWAEEYLRENATLKQRQLFSDIIAFLEKDCFLTSWEVWT